MKIRIDVNNPLSEKEKPELIGLWLEGFGQIIGSFEQTGDLVIDGTISVAGSTPNSNDSQKFLSRASALLPIHKEDIWKVSK